MSFHRRIPSVLFKSSLLAAAIFWIQFLPADFHPDMVPFLIISMIPITIVASMTIVITVLPFYYIEENRKTNHDIFKTYFPYYSIFAFGISVYFIITSNFESIVCAFFTSAFFTLITSWIWLYKTPTATEEKENNIGKNC